MAHAILGDLGALILPSVLRIARLEGVIQIPTPHPAARFRHEAIRL